MNPTLAKAYKALIKARTLLDFAQWGEDANMAAVDAVDAEIDAAIEAIENDGKDKGGEVRDAVEA